MLFCPSHVQHAQHFGPSGALKLLFTPPADCLDYLNDCGIALADAPFIRSRAVARIGARAVHELMLADSHSRLALESLLLELVAAFASAEPSMLKIGAPAWLARAREIIEDSETNIATLGQLAAQVGRHPVHLAREFRGHFGRTVGEYLREKRAIKAAVLLRGSRLSLAEIALTCGYSGQAAFSRAFKAVYDTTPSNFRARMN